jgi:starch phosphorylase
MREKQNKLTPENNCLKGGDSDSIKRDFVNHLEYTLGKNSYTATEMDKYFSLAYAIRDRLTEKWTKTQEKYYEKDPKKIYYLSLEFLIGRTLGNSLINLDLYDNTDKAVSELGNNLDDLRKIECDAGLGNGGLGRLAACFLDSMATLNLPATGYGIRYEFGIFFQMIVDGYQVEQADNWLRYGNPWEFPRPERIYPVQFYGNIENYCDTKGHMRHRWVNTEVVMAMAYDTLIPGYKCDTVNNLRLWSAKSSREFNLQYFNDGDYRKAVAEKSISENISKVLYPNDNILEGKELRLKQEYFFVSATLQDIIKEYKRKHSNYDSFSKKVAIQLNDTHPAIAIPELMRILVDEESLPWEYSWKVTVDTFGYTNHTILPEALEKWSVSLMTNLLPRHMQIIYEINHRFLKGIKNIVEDNIDMLRSLSLIEEGEEKQVKMANLAIVGSHSLNGVAALHTEILKKNIFSDFYSLFPEKFNNKTNGITQRRWLRLCNPGLSKLIDSKIGDGWTKDLRELKKLLPFAKDKDFHKEWNQVKKQNKERLRKYILNRNKIDVNTDSIFDCHIKRIHEYKRQLLNGLSVIRRYNRIKANPNGNFQARTIIFAGKAAPGYHMAKLIIKLINSVGEIVNNDSDVRNRLKVLFLRNYAVSNAEKIIPSADLSEQISTAGTEASGTGNMKFALNGALTIGTLDGANIEIMEEVGKENIFIFGLDESGVDELKANNYNPWDYYHRNSDLRQVLDMINNGYFSKDDPNRFKPIVQSLLNYGDNYMLLADYESYIEMQDVVDKVYGDRDRWTEMAIKNVANMGKFSTDRTIGEYADEIWNVKPV